MSVLPPRPARVASGTPITHALLLPIGHLAYAADIQATTFGHDLDDLNRCCDTIAWFH